MLRHRIQKIAGICLGLGFLSYLNGSVQAESQPKTSEGAAGKAELTIVRPKPNERFVNQPVVVQVAVKNFVLTPPEPRSGEPVTESTGHLHYYLDSNPLIATSSEKLMFGHEFSGNAMADGEHTLTVELVYENHRGLVPRLWRQVRFYTGNAEEPQQDSFVGSVK